jgi:cytoskeletal protein CcmA (bactofilin family)
MRRNPLYVFIDLSSTGLFDVPLDSTIQINDSDGLGTPKIIQLVDKSGLYQEITIGEFLANFPNNYTDLNTATEIPSELERIYQPLTPNIYGWRLLGMDPNNYGVIGRNAVDFSIVKNTGGIISNYGATGEYSFASGYKTKAEGYAAHAEGIGTIAKNKSTFACGMYNEGFSDKNIFEVGIGLGIGTRQNAFEISDTGILRAPAAENIDIELSDDFALITKGYANFLAGDNLPITGGVLDGDLVINGTDDSIPSLINKRDALFEGAVIFGGGIKAGLNDELNSQILFTDTDPNVEPILEWNTTQQEFILIKPGVVGGVIWHSGNDGIGSELDAGKLGGKWANEYVINSDLQLELDAKYDKTGGTISGNVDVDADLSVTGTLTTNNFISLDTMTINNEFIVNGDGTFNDSLYANNKFYPTTIDSNVHFKEISYVDARMDFTEELRIQCPINIEPNYGGRSQLSFIDAFDDTKYTNIFWDATQADFFVDYGDDVAYKVLTDNNYPPQDRVTSFDQLNDTPASKEAGYYLRISSDGQNIEYIDKVDVTYIIDDTAEAGVYDRTWSASKVYNQFLEKLDINGGSVFGTLDVQGELIVSEDLTVGQDLTVNGNITVTGDIIFENLPTSDPGNPGQVYVDGTTGNLKISL